EAGVELVAGEDLADALRKRSELEEVTAVLMLTAEDGYNSLAANVLAGQSDTPVYRLAPSHGFALEAREKADAALLFSSTLTHDAITRRYESGWRVSSKAASGAALDGIDLLFLIDREGHLRPVTTSDSPTPNPGDTVIALGAP